MGDSALPRWTRPGQFLVYLVPVGDIPLTLFASYVNLLQTQNVLYLRSLTRPGGYAAELSPFRHFNWTGPGSLRFHFVSPLDHEATYDGEDTHACYRVIGALGICHSPSLVQCGGCLRTALSEFQAAIASFQGLLIHKLFAFEHTFNDTTAIECQGLDDLVMFPVHQELDGTGESTVSLHLQVVMENVGVTILMSLESAIRSATSSAVLNGARLTIAKGHVASVLLDINVEPNGVAAYQVDSCSETRGDAPAFSLLSSPTRRFSHASSSPRAPLTPSVTVNRRRKRQVARREKLVGDYNVLVSCISDAIDHYTVAIEMLREQERRSGGAPGDALWLAAALEGYVFCLYTESQDKFRTELVEKASEAVEFYAKAGTTELESRLIENLGLYYARVAMATLTCTSMTGETKLLESIWMKRLLWDVLERGMMLFPELQPQRRVEVMIQTSRILDTVGHRRRAALFLHEAASLLLNRNAPSIDAQKRLLLSPTDVNKGCQRQRDLKAALILEGVAAERLGIQGQSTRKGVFLPWEVTTQHRRIQSSGSSACTTTPDNAWLIVRFHVLRQLLTIARMLGDALLVGTYCLQLLELLVCCDSIAVPPIIDPQHTCSSSSVERAPASHATLQMDHLQRPAALLRISRLPVERVAAGLHAKSGVYFFPPLGIDTKVKRNFINSPSATMSNAAASFSSTLANTPRMLATPRQQFSAAVNAISSKAPPAFTPFSSAHHQHNGPMSGDPDGEDRPATNVFDQEELGSADVNKEGDSLEAGDSKLHLNNAVTEPDCVWDLRSKTAIAKIEGKLLHMLKSECATLRGNEQTQLPTFLRVEKLKLRSRRSLQNPFLSRMTALQMYGVQSASSQQAVRSDFFYSPFQQQKMRRTGQRESNGEEEDSDDTPAIYEKSFPVNERIELQLTLSNPMGVVVKLQEVKAWVTFLDEDDSVIERNGSTKQTAKGGRVECHPCLCTLEPYQKRKALVLSIQPLRVGTFQVRGCFIKAFNIKTSFEVDTPVNIFVVDELPRVSLSLRQHNSMTLLSDEKVDMSTEPVARLAMFLFETRQCTVRICSTGNRQITNYRLAVTVQHRRAAKHTCVIFNNLPPSSIIADASRVEVSRSIIDKTGADEPGKVDTQFLSLKCGKVVSSPLPLASGDVVSIPFEVSPRKTHESVEGGIQIEWCIVYADEDPLSPNDIDASEGAIFYRESKLAFELVLLPSLMLQSVTLLPCCTEQIPTPRDKNDVTFGIGNVAEVMTTDHSYCVIVVHIVNPTETSFRFRLRHDTDNSSDITCEEEIGRQCSRRFMVEVPRLQSLTLDQGPSSLIDVLNGLVKMEWETYYGTRGRLLCEDHHVTDHRQAKFELLLPPVRFQIESPHKELAPAGAGEKQNGDMGVLKSQRGTSTSFHTLSFFELPHLSDKLQKLQTEVFKYVPIAIAAQRVDIGDQLARGVEVEVVIAEEGEEAVCELSDHVMVVGQLKTYVRWDERMDMSTKLHKIQCMFLSEGNFRVTVCGRVLGPDMQQFGGEIWCHQPIHVCVRSEAATVAEKIVTII